MSTEVSASTRLNIDGQTDGFFTVGDEVYAVMYKKDGREFGRLEGKITEIFICYDKLIHQLRINNGWCCHPDKYFGNDHVSITKKYKNS